MNKIAVSATDLHALLEREFERRKPRGCDACAVSIPFSVTARGREATNWETVPLGSCGLVCAPVLEEIVVELQRIYALMT